MSFPPLAPKTRRLSKIDWLEEGQAVLSKGGISAVKLSTLQKRLKVSSGSFYHHFRDFDEYLTELAEYFSASTLMENVYKFANEGADPISRIRRLASASIKTGLFPLDSAMRVWAASDKRAVAAIMQSEKRGMEFLSTAFEDLGFDENDAAFRAQVLLAVNVSRLHFDPKLAQSRFHDMLLTLLSGPAASTDQPIQR